MIKSNGMPAVGVIVDGLGGPAFGWDLSSVGKNTRTIVVLYPNWSDDNYVFLDSYSRDTGDVRIDYARLVLELVFT